MKPVLSCRLPPVASVRALVLATLVAALWLDARPLSQASSQTYVVYTPDGRRSLPFRSGHGTDMVPLEQLGNLFNVSVAEDSLVGGLIVRGRGQTILLIPGQSFASIGPGKIVSLPAPLTRERNVWQVPIEFVRQVLAPALNVRVDVRRATRVLLIGDVRLPRVTGRFERLGANARLLLEIQPATPHRVTRVGNRLTVRFEAVALEFTPVQGILREFVGAIRADGTGLVLELGPETINFRATDPDPTHLTLEFIALAPPPPPPPPPPAVQVPAPAPAPGPMQGTGALVLPGRGATPDPARPIIDSTPGTLRTVVIDPGHGGEDTGVTGPGGTTEKDYVLQFARRLKAAIEARIGVRVLLTRDNDDAVPLDRRTAIANNNKADLFISLHANASRRPTATGAQVLTLRLDDYRGRSASPDSGDLPVAFLGGGTRTISLLPWDLAQIGFADESAAVATLLQRNLAERNVPLFSRATSQMALRPLVGASMPAVLIELGFLSNPEDEKALNGADRTPRTIEAILDTLADIRRGIPRPPVDAPR